MQRFRLWDLPILWTIQSESDAEHSQLALVGSMLSDGDGGPPVHHAAILIGHNRWQIHDAQGICLLSLDVSTLGYHLTF